MKSLHRYYFFALLGLIFTGRPAWAKTVRIACVDCYSSASLYPSVVNRLRDEGAIPAGTEVEWVLVQTHPYTQGEGSYLNVFPSTSRRLEYDAEKDASWLDKAERDLRALGIHSILEGMDEGSYQAPVICERLGLPHNSVALRGHRKHKDLQMQLAGSDYGIPTLRLIDVDATLAWIQAFPHEEMVVKFNDGVSGFGMKDFSKNDPDLRQKLQAMLDGPKIGPFGKEDFFIVQPKIRGRKFFINTFSFEGQAVVTGLSEYHMIEANGTTLYFLDAFLGLDSLEAKLLTPAAAAINQRMAVLRGPAHVEFIVDEKTGRIYLLENNVRIAGAGVPAMETQVYGIGQLELQLLSILNPKLLRTELSKYPRARRAGGMIAVIPNAHPGRLSTTGVHEIERLSSYYSPGPQYRLVPESRVPRTTDQRGATLLHLLGTRESLRADINQIVAMVSEQRLVEADPESFCAKELAALGGVLQRRVQTMDWASLPH